MITLRTDCSGNPSFVELLNRVVETTLAAYDNQDVSFGHVVNHLKVERSLAWNPIFQVMLFVQVNDDSFFKLNEITSETFHLSLSGSKYDLSLWLRETKEGVSLGFEYALDLFERTTIERMAENFQILIQNIITNPNQKISEIPLLSKNNSQILLIEWNDTKTNYSSQFCIHELFEEMVKNNPSKVALIYEDNELTYYELNARANKLAHFLKELGGGPEVCIGICLERTQELIIALLSVLKVGSYYIPIEPTHPQKRIQSILEDAKPSILLAHSRFSEILRKYRGSVVYLDLISEKIDPYSQDNLKNRVTPKNLVYVIYTSGTTGKPKGVMIEHGAFVAKIQAIKNQYFDGICGINTCSFTNYIFDPFGLEYGLPLISGGAVTLADVHGLTTLDCSNFDFVQFTPSLGNLMLDCLESTIHTKLLIGGEPLTSKLLDKALYVSTNVINVYGPTETTIWLTSHLYSTENYGSNSQILEKSSLRITIGKPLNNENIYILSSNLDLVPIGAIGELYIGGVGLARGYLDSPVLTADKYIPNPFVCQEEILDPRNLRLYRTGDLARYFPDGTIECLGRTDEQVKVRGFRTELEEIRTALIGYNTISEVIVIAKEDENANNKLIAYLVLEKNVLSSYQIESHASAGKNIFVLEGESISRFTEALKRYLFQILPDYMIPSFYIYLDKFPLNTNNKIDIFAFVNND